jgi:hypothetical protein
MGEALAGHTDASASKLTGYREPNIADERTLIIAHSAS